MGPFYGSLINPLDLMQPRAALSADPRVLRRTSWRASQGTAKLRDEYAKTEMLLCVIYIYMYVFNVLVYIAFVHTYVYEYMYSYIHTYIHTYIHASFVCLFVCLFVCMCVCLFPALSGFAVLGSVYSCTYLHVCMPTHICLHVYVYIHGSLVGSTRKAISTTNRKSQPRTIHPKSLNLKR